MEDSRILLTKQDLMDYWENLTGLESDDDVGISGTDSLDEPEQYLSLNEEICATKLKQLDLEFEIYAGHAESQVSLYHDNCYTSLSLMVYLAKEGIHSLGTVRRNCSLNCKLPTDLIVKSQPRGTSYKYVALVEGVDISSIIWKDNKCVTLLSSFIGRQRLCKVTKYDRKEKNTKDLLDSNMGRYIISLKNQFRAALAETWCYIGRCPLKRSRRSALENKIADERRKGPTQHVPPRKVRTDQLGHWSILKAKK
ncbi:hypothetical protein ILUMI_02160 [Ignelater luminosus]|uniref:PiggyBac transposable element-derived protein domain-containing protein n=1 Tax=Ignelater luminosus TaxID=2038154 RepID=A0A8K0DPB2_IGNLU|nr:hypothetical protein ILUMI_02160 [Ignelater luminosus]